MIRTSGVLALLAALLAAAPSKKLSIPPAGILYHGVYPGGKSGEEDDLAPDDLAAYRKAAGRDAAWVYFSNNWFRSRAFPKKTAGWIRNGGAAPFIRLMLRSDSEQDHAEPLFNADAIAAGKFDDDLKRWGAEAGTFGPPLLVEWGTECNGEWFSWNGKWNGAGEKKKFGDPEKPDGPERFAAAYRRIVEKVREGGGRDVQWVFHPDCQDVPEEKWNRLENYYPGGDVVDFVAVSVYGPQTPDDEESESFRKRLDRVYPRLEKLGKPMIVAEFGCTTGHPKVKADAWAKAALDDLLSGRWPKVMGFSWWNERWENGDGKKDTDMRIQGTAALGEVFRKKLAEAGEKLATRPLEETAGPPAAERKPD